MVFGRTKRANIGGQSSDLHGHPNSETSCLMLRKCSADLFFAHWSRPFKAWLTIIAMRRPGPFFSLMDVVLKGTVAWDGFCPFDHVRLGNYGSDFFLFWPKIRRDKLNFISIGVFYIYGKYSWRSLQIRLSSLGVFSMHAEILLAYSETTLYI
jgi:hypothetical protein